MNNVHLSQYYSTSVLFRLLSVYKDIPSICDILVWWPLMFSFQYYWQQRNIYYFSSFNRKVCSFQHLFFVIIQNLKFLISHRGILMMMCCQLRIQTLIIQNLKFLISHRGILMMMCCQLRIQTLIIQNLKFLISHRGILMMMCCQLRIQTLIIQNLKFLISHRGILMMMCCQLRIQTLIIGFHWYTRKYFR